MTGVLLAAYISRPAEPLHWLRRADAVEYAFIRWPIQTRKPETEGNASLP